MSAFSIEVKEITHPLEANRDNRHGTTAATSWAVFCGKGRRMLSTNKCVKCMTIIKSTCLHGEWRTACRQTQGCYRGFGMVSYMHTRRAPPFLFWLASEILGSRTFVWHAHTRMWCPGVEREMLCLVPEQSRWEKCIVKLKKKSDVFWLLLFFFITQWQELFILSRLPLSVKRFFFVWRQT